LPLTVLAKALKTCCHCLPLPVYPVLILSSGGDGADGSFSVFILLCLRQLSG
jgi:hypothetical protein